MKKFVENVFDVKRLDDKLVIYRLVVFIVVFIWLLFVVMRREVGV